MSDDARHIDVGLAEDGRPVVLLRPGGEQADDMAALLRFAPALQATDLAMAVNHFAHGSDYRVIIDPAAFEQDYRARLAREDAHDSWQEGAVRLSDFGVPDFSTIQPPHREGTSLVFFGADSFLGVPYKVTAPDIQEAPTYSPLPLTPVASPRPHSTSPLTAPADPADDPPPTTMPGDRPAPRS